MSKDKTSRHPLYKKTSPLHNRKHNREVIYKKGGYCSNSKSLRNSFDSETTKIPTTEETIKKRKKSLILFSEAALLIEIPPKFL